MDEIRNFISGIVYFFNTTKFEVTLAEMMFGILIVLATALVSLIFIKSVKVIRRHIEKQKEIDIRLGQTLLNIQTTLAQEFPAQAKPQTISEETASIKSMPQRVEPVTPIHNIPDLEFDLTKQLTAIEETAAAEPEAQQAKPEQTMAAEQPVKVKKTREMSMEERWADFEARRAAERELARNSSFKRKQRTA